MPETLVTPSTDLAIRARPPVRPARKSLVARTWPGPASPAGPAPLAAAAGAGLLAAGLVPLGQVGVGWLLAGLAVGTATAVGVRLAGSAAPAGGTIQTSSAGDAAGPDTNGTTPTSSPTDAGTAAATTASEAAGTAAATTASEAIATGPAAPGEAAPSRRHRIEALAWGVVALVLLSVGALRAAEWLFGLCLFAAAVATVLAVTGGRTVRGLALGALLVPAAAWRGAAWGYRGIAGLRGRVRPTVRVIPTVAITTLVLLVFGALLASADAAFARVLGSALPDLEIGTTLRWEFLFAGGAALVLAAVFLLLAPPTVDQPRPGGGREVRLVEWAVPVGALVALFAGFVGVQLTVLFGGAAYVVGPDGPTYAEHARGGFWQLLAVTALTLLVIGVAARVAPRRAPVDRWCLRGLVGGLAVLTLLIVASALYRMYTYQEAYGFTRLRVLVSIVELWLGLVFVLVLVAGVRLRGHWLPRAVVATGVIAVLGLAALNPDRFIAERNLDRWAAGERLDVAYLAGLSADAAPALVCLPEPERREALAGIRAQLADSPGGWRDANLARSIARDLVRQASTSPEGCRP